MIYVFGADPLDYSPSSKSLLKQLIQAGFKRSELKYVENADDIGDGNYVLCFGSTGFKQLVGRDEPLTSVRGEMFHAKNRKDVLVFPTYAPGYLYRNAKAIPFFKDDLQLFRVFIHFDQTGEVI